MDKINFVTVEDAAAIAAGMERIEERLNDMESQMGSVQFVAQFGDLRALARKITKEQRREKITEGT